jgi:hypothetical protein
MSSPIEFFEKRFCEKCRNHVCRPKGMSYSIGAETMIPCILAAIFLAETDRGLLKKK